MYRRGHSRTLYRAVARRVWERYRPSLLDLPVGFGLLRDRGVGRGSKVLALGLSSAVAVGLFGIQSALAWTIGLRGPVASVSVELALAAGVLAIAAPLAMVRLAAPEEVVRARLRRVRVIPLRRP